MKTYLEISIRSRKKDESMTVSVRRRVENFSPCVGMPVSTSAWNDPKTIRHVSILAGSPETDELVQIIRLEEDVVDSSDDFPWSERLYQDHGWHKPGAEAEPGDE